MPSQERLLLRYTCLATILLTGSSCVPLPSASCISGSSVAETVHMALRLQPLTQMLTCLTIGFIHNSCSRVHGTRLALPTLEKGLDERDLRQEANGLAAAVVEAAQLA